MKLWAVFDFVDDSGGGHQTMLVGVFDSEEKAQRCLGDFDKKKSPTIDGREYMAIILNESLYA